MKPLHFLLRYSDQITKVDTIEEHIKVLDERGFVWMGKFGIGISRKFYNLASDQIAKNQETFLFLMKGSSYTHTAKVCDMSVGENSRVEIPCMEQELIPSYYRRKRCTVWFKLKSIEKFDHEELKNLWLYNDAASHPSSSGMRGLVYLTHSDGQKRKVVTKPRSDLWTKGLFE